MNYQVKRLVVLSLGIVFVFFLSIFINQKISIPESTKSPGFHIQPLGQGFTNVEGSLNHESKGLNYLQDYPDPVKFKHFGISALPLKIIDSCKDDYYAALVYNKDIDYRKNPAAALVNKAYQCPGDGKFIFELLKEDLIKYDSGNFYVIIADQGEKGIWYNPR